MKQDRRFAVTLNALPFVSSKSKEKALDALRSFSTNYVPPTVFEPGTMVALYSKKLSCEFGKL